MKNLLLFVLIAFSLATVAQSQVTATQIKRADGTTVIVRTHKNGQRTATSYDENGSRIGGMQWGEGSHDEAVRTMRMPGDQIRPYRVTKKKKKFANDPTAPVETSAASATGVQ